jgi:hypothetical protein
MCNLSSSQWKEKEKMVTFRSAVIFMVLAAFVSLAVGCSSNEPPNKLSGVTQEEGQPAAANPEEQPVATNEGDLPGVAPKEVAEEQAPDATPKTLALTGTIEKAGDNMILSTDLGDYIIAGQDLTEMVGKTVNVTGAVEEANGQYTINVLSFSQE